jgi:hypothetical protein
MVTSNSYRAAYESGCAEIEQIIERMASLHARKEQMDKVITALKTIIEPGSVSEVSRPQPVPVAAPQPVEAAPSNRMQQHIDQVLRSLATA